MAVIYIPTLRFVSLEEEQNGAKNETLSDTKRSPANTKDLV